MFWRVVQTLIADRTQQKGSCFMTEDSNQSSTVQELSGDESGDSVENLRKVVCRWKDFDGHEHEFELTQKIPRVLICGGRDFTGKKNYILLAQFMDRLCYDRGWITPPHESGVWLPLVHVIAGGAKGADTAAIDWATWNWISFKEYPADWDKYGKSAGYIRNKQMLDEGKPDLVVAFPGGKGTAMMVDIAKKAGVETIIVDIESLNDLEFPTVTRQPKEKPPDAR